MRNKPRNPETFPAKTPDPSMNQGVYSGWKNYTGHSKDDPHAQVARENFHSGDIPVRLLDNANWLVSRQTDPRRNDSR